MIDETMSFTRVSENWIAYSVESHHKKSSLLNCCLKKISDIFIGPVRWLPDNPEAVARFHPTKGNDLTTRSSTGEKNKAMTWCMKCLLILYGSSILIKIFIYPLVVFRPNFNHWISIFSASYCQSFIDFRKVLVSI